VLVVNVGVINDLFKSGDQVTPEKLAEANLAKGCYDELKILGDGEVTKKLKISAHRFSKSAAEKIAAAGGETIVLPGKAPVVKNKKDRA
jgi:large subunit ribosomal protein L15